MSEAIDIFDFGPPYLPLRYNGVEVKFVPNFKCGALPSRTQEI